MMTALTRSAADRLRTDFRGLLILPGDEGYDAARAVWNGAIDRRPALIAMASGTCDVVTAVRFAREQGLPVSIRGGGHSAAGFAVADWVRAVTMVPSCLRPHPERRKSGPNDPYDPPTVRWQALATGQCRFGL